MFYVCEINSGTKFFPLCKGFNLMHGPQIHGSWATYDPWTIFLWSTMNHFRDSFLVKFNKFVLRPFYTFAVAVLIMSYPTRQHKLF